MIIQATTLSKIEIVKKKNKRLHLLTPLYLILFDGSCIFVCNTSKQLFDFSQISLYFLKSNLPSLSENLQLAVSSQHQLKTKKIQKKWLLADQLNKTTTWYLNNLLGSVEKTNNYFFYINALDPTFLKLTTRDIFCYLLSPFIFQTTRSQIENYTESMDFSLNNSESVQNIKKTFIKPILPHLNKILSMNKMELITKLNLILIRQNKEFYSRIIELEPAVTLYLTYLHSQKEINTLCNKKEKKQIKKYTYITNNALSRKIIRNIIYAAFKKIKKIENITISSSFEMKTKSAASSSIKEMHNLLICWNSINFIFDNILKKNIPIINKHKYTMHNTIIIYSFCLLPSTSRKSKINTKFVHRALSTHFQQYYNTTEYTQKKFSNYVKNENPIKIQQIHKLPINKQKLTCKYSIHPAFGGTKWKKKLNVEKIRPFFLINFKYTKQKQREKQKNTILINGIFLLNNETGKSRNIISNFIDLLTIPSNNTLNRLFNPFQYLLSSYVKQQQPQKAFILLNGCSLLFNI